jgi:hypothetical protein
MLWQYARRRGALAVAAAVGIWFGSTFVYQWGPLARVDMLGVALSIAAVLLVDGQVSSRSLLAAALLCSLALLTKQTLLAAPVAILAFLAWRRDWRGAWFVVMVVVVVGGVSAAFNLLSNGQYAQHVLFGNATNPFRVDRMFELSGTFVLLNVCACCAGTWTLVREARSTRPSVVAFYAPLAIATVLTIGNVSGDVNYFLEPTAALAMLTAAAAATIPRALYAGLLCLQLAVLFHVPNGFMSQFPPGPAKGATPVPEDVLAGDHVLAAVRAAEGPTLVEPAGFSVLAGSTVWAQPIDLIAEQHRGRWTPGLMVAAVEQHRWALVVLNYKFLPSEVLDALERTYELTEGIPSPNGFSYFIYRPRPTVEASGSPGVTGVTAVAAAP